MDLICIKNDDCIDEGLGVCLVNYVQCKTNGRISRAEKEIFIIHSLKYGARPVLAYKDKKGHIVTEVLS